MPRKSGTQITGEMARKIVKKLKAKQTTRPGLSNAHKYYDVFHDDGRLVLTFSIRHSNAKYLGHDHLLKDLFVSASKGKCLARCTYSKKEWIAHLIEIGEFSS
jgi:hypothetical protein